MTANVTVPCATCGTPVRGVDPDRGMVSRPDVLCGDCLDLESCINCRRVFRGDESKCVYMAEGERVGPFCGTCERILEHGKATATAARRHG